MTRIAHFYRDYLAGGGMPRETALLAAAMGRHAERIFAYCYTSDRSRAGEHQQGPVTVRAFYVPSWCLGRNCFYVPSELRKLIESNSDHLDSVLITASFLPENAPVARLLRKTGIPYFVSVGEGFNPFVFDGIRGLKKAVYGRLLEAPILQNAAGIRLYSGIQQQHVEQRIPLTSPKFFIIKEGIDSEEIRYPALAEPNGEQPEPVFGFLGRLEVRKKGLDLLLDAWAIYRRRGGRGSLLIAGPASPRELQKLEGQCRELRITDIALLSPQYGPEKVKFLSKLTALVHPSRHEGIPRVIREALALRCPVVVTENTNLHDIVSHYGCGAVVDTTPESIANGLGSIEQALFSSQIVRMRTAAAEATCELDWDSISRQYLGYLTRNLASNQRVRASSDQ